MSTLFDRLINFLKWPVAIYMVLVLPAYIQSLSYFQFFNWKYMAMMGGFFMFFIVLGTMDKEVKTNMEIVVHELTHALFAALTFHKVKGIRANADNSGGSMSFEGEGNWLITIAPYFFPLFGFIVMIGISIFTNISAIPATLNPHLLVNGILGMFIGYHFDAVGSQIHEKQTDLPKAGYGFCVMFLPSANLWAVGSMLAFNSQGWDGFFKYQRLISYLNDRNYAYVTKLLASIF